MLQKNVFEPTKEGNVVFSMDISAALAAFLYTESCFQDLTGEKLSYEKILGKEHYDSLKTHQEALGSVDVMDKTLACNYWSDGETYDPSSLSYIMSSLYSYLGKFKWHSDRPCLYKSLSTIIVIYSLSEICRQEGEFIKVSGAD